MRTGPNAENAINPIFFTEVSDSPISDKIKDVEQAVTFLLDGGSIDSVPDKFLDDAIRLSNAFQITGLGTGVDLLVGRKSESYYRLNQLSELAALSVKVSSDLRDWFGLPLCKVRYLNSGPSRKLLFSFPKSLSSIVALKRLRLHHVDDDQFLRLAISDYLLDQRRRNPSSLMPVMNGKKVNLFVIPDQYSLGAGLPSEELEARGSLVLGEGYPVWSGLRTRFTGLSQTQRKSLLSLYEALLERAKVFDWDGYQKACGFDGVLSDSEKAYFKMIRSTYDERLRLLESDKDASLVRLGLVIGNAKMLEFLETRLIKTTNIVGVE
jgi:hypothetical protein